MAGTSKERYDVAVIGAGIAGLGAAYDLCHHHDVTIIEARKRLGGHARTLIAGRDVQFAVDTGFIVFNEKTYPNFCALMKTLGVAYKPSEMSFSVRCSDSGLSMPTSD